MFVTDKLLFKITDIFHISYFCNMSNLVSLFQVERNRDLMRKYEEQTLQQREMIKEMNDMRQLLQQHRVGMLTPKQPMCQITPGRCCFT